MYSQLAVALASILLVNVPTTSGHGRLIQPPSRSSAWRFTFPTPKNFNDHEIYCGGFARQWTVNGGKCGPCGDPWDEPQPRSNEGGGKYGRGVIVATYQVGAPIEIGIELTAAHKGYFEFRICPHNDPLRPVSDECLDRHVLQRSDGSGPRFYPVESDTYIMRYQLPEDMSCQQCVLQWRYVAGNNWGKCANGTGGLGCGPQEEFRACADVTVTHKDGSADSTPALPPAVPPRQDDEDYNEVDTDRLDNIKPGGSYVGHVVALTLAGLLLPLLLLAIILYFYFARETVRKVVKKHAGFWKRCKKSSNPEEAADKNANFSVPPSGEPPKAPPRRARRSSSSVSPSDEQTKIEPSSSIPV